MQTDIQSLNKHIFSEGNVQFSVFEIQQLNNQPPTVFKATFEKGYCRFWLPAFTYLLCE